MIPLSVILIIVAMHGLFDWWLQTSWQAQNKSKNWEALSRHVLTYTVGLGLAATLIFVDFYAAVAWILVNSILHFATDAITSRITAKYFGTKTFWNTIGTDQVIHFYTLFGTFVLLN